MELYVHHSPSPKHTTAPCSSVVWLSDGSLASVGDGAISQWSATGELLTQLFQLPDKKILQMIAIPLTKKGPVTTGSFVAARTPNAGSSTAGMTGPSSNSTGLLHDVALAACSDGTLLFVHVGNRRVEKTVEAHRGCVTALAFHPDHSCFATCGEDGVIKLWSPAGIQRAILVQSDDPILALVWCPVQSSGAAAEMSAASTPAAGTTASQSLAHSHMLLYAQGMYVHQRGTHPGLHNRRQQRSWKAHDGLVLTLDSAQDKIVTGGEDGRYRVWDAYGRMLYSFQPPSDGLTTRPITKVSFSPDARYIAVGSSDQIRICDQAGWSYARKRVASVGSIYGFSWLSDSTQLAAGTAGGHVLFAQIVHFHATWKNFVCRVIEPTKVMVIDVSVNAGGDGISGAGGSEGQSEIFEVRDRIIRVKIGYGHLIILTTTQCSVHSLNVSPETFLPSDATKSVAMNSRSRSSGGCLVGSPILLDTKNTIHSVYMSPTTFALLDSSGVQVIGYDGRPMMSLRLHARHLSLSSDTIAVVEVEDARRVIFFDSRTGRPLKDATITHSCEIVEIALNHYGSIGAPVTDRQLAFRDHNGDAFLMLVHDSGAGSGGSSSSSSGGSGVGVGGNVSSSTSAHAKRGNNALSTDATVGQALKLVSMVTSLHWHTAADMLLLISDRKLIVSYCPGAVFVDRDLSSLTRRIPPTGSSDGSGASALLHAYGGVGVDGINTVHEFEREDTILDFVGDIYTVRRGSDGARLTLHVPSPYPRVLYRHIQARKWSAAVRVCRVAREPYLWCILAVHAVRTRQLEIAEGAYAALEEVGKVRHMQYIRSLVSPEHQHAELALFQHRTEEAEAVLLAAGLIYRAIRMHIRLFNWDRALEIATERRTHVDTVLAFRQKYLDSFGKPETHERYLHFFNSGITIDPDVINTKIKEEKEKERNASLAQAASSSNVNSSSSKATSGKGATTSNAVSGVVAGTSIPSNALPSSNASPQNGISSVRESTTALATSAASSAASSPVGTVGGPTVTKVSASVASVGSASNLKAAASSSRIAGGGVRK